uniref:Uncharacterized protein n=1 Tax=Anguilla anguilla TaxID=7936 RepID=A0A0E9X424_ANGAN
MGNNECHEVYRLGRDVGMIPDPQMDQTFTSYLSPDSSTHLSSHYMDVRRSLSPEQLGVFNHSLRATLGESGKVTQGGVGVVALALSFLFDVLAQQAKNQTGSTHFIHRIFREHEGNNISETGTVISDYLRLVPLIANDPQRMKEETERYKQRLNCSLVSHFDRIAKSPNNSWTEWKIFIHGLMFYQYMMMHQVLMGVDEAQLKSIETDMEKLSKKYDKNNTVFFIEITNVAERLRSISPEKQFLLTKCENIEQTLLITFLFEVGKEVLTFLLSLDRYAPLSPGQNQDFFY